MCRPAVAPAPSALSARQVQAMDLLVRGLRDREIGKALGISWRTAQKHVDTACAKLGGRTRPHAAVIYTRSRHA